MRFLLLLALLYTPALYAQKQQPVTSTVEEATVFTRGAQVQRSAKVSIPAGRTELVFTGLATTLDPQSVQIRAGGNFTLLSVTHQLNYVQPNADRSEIRRLQNAFQQLSDEQAQNKALLQVYQNEEKMMQANQSIGGANTGVNTAALREALDFHRQRLTDLLQKQIVLQRNIARTDSLLAVNQAQQQTLNGSGPQPSGELVVTVQAATALNTQFTLSYFVQQAGWFPGYDAKVTSLAAPLELSIRAQVFQQSGETWPQVKLRLSTGNPNERGVAPVLYPWNLNLYQPQLSSRLRGRAAGLSVESAQADEVVVSAAGIARKEMAYAAAPITVSELNQATTIVYDIAEPYTIANDGKQYMVQVKQVQLPAEYEYISIPKLDKAAYLTARVTDWQELNLGDGDMNLFLEGSYLGKSRLVTSTASDTLVLSLGRDKGITVQRNPLKQFTSKQFLSGNRTDSRGYELIVRNNKTVPINLVLQDQLPNPANKEITVSEESYDGAELNPDTKLLTWRLNIAPRTEVKKQLKYSVRYPKNQRVLLD